MIVVLVKCLFNFLLQILLSCFVRFLGDFPVIETLETDKVETLTRGEITLSSHSKSQSSLTSVLASKVVKFYAIHKGFHPGIYSSWEECNREVSEYRGAKFKSFRSRHEVEDFIKQQ